MRKYGIKPYITTCALNIEEDDYVFMKGKQTVQNTPKMACGRCSTGEKKKTNKQQLNEIECPRVNSANSLTLQFALIPIYIGAVPTDTTMQMQD